MDFPGRVIPPLNLAAISRYGIAQACNLSGSLSSMASAVYPAANQAIYIPFQNPFYYPVARLSWVNGATVSGNVDAGIYNLAGVRIFSVGSTAQSGVNSHQDAVPATPFILAPGAYYMAIAMDNITGTLMQAASITANEGRLAGLLQQATAFPLPATATFAQWATSGVPFLSLSRV